MTWSWPGICRLVRSYPASCASDYCQAKETKMKLRNRGIAVLIALTAILLFAAPALAADNVRIAGTDSFTDRHSCVDPLQVDVTYDVMVHIFYDADGNPTQLSFTGAFTLQYTNLTTRATYRPNSSGPGLVDLATGQAT